MAHAHPPSHGTPADRGGAAERVPAGERVAAADRVAAAEARARAGGVRLTDTRRAVLGALIGAGRPLGAYDIVEAVGAPAGARRPAPISVYRALDALLAAGLVHRIESRNAYLACDHPGHAHAPAPGAPRAVAFLICGACGRTAEAESDALSAALRALSAGAAFRPAEQVVEVAGLCAACADAPGPLSDAGPMSDPRKDPA